MSSRNQNIVQWLLVFIILVMLNVVAQFIRLRLDLTADKRFTLSESTKELVRSLDDRLLIKVYLEGEFPSGFRRLRNETRLLLDEFRTLNDNIEFQFINPSESREESERLEVYRQLAEKGLEPTRLQSNEGDSKKEQVVFPGALLYYQNREQGVMLLKSRMGEDVETQINNSIQSLEFEIANTIRKVKKAGRKSVAILEGHGELVERETESFQRDLSQTYDIGAFNLRQFEVDSITGEVSISNQINRLARFDAVVVAKPREPFTELDKYILDQYLMLGGKILWLIDATNADMDSLSNQAETVFIPRELNLDDMLFRYGVRLNDNLVQDLQCALIPIVVDVVNNQPKYEFFPWPYFPLVLPDVDHPIVKNLNGVKFDFVSSLDTIKAAGVEKTILLNSSGYTKLSPTPHIITISKINQPPNEREYNRPPAAMAVLLEGVFTSNFQNRLLPKDESGQNLKVIGESKPTAQIVVADGDLIRNQRSQGKALPLGFDKYSGQLFGNRDFLMNCMDYLLDDSGLIQLRSREFTLRLLDGNRVKKEKSKYVTLNLLLPPLMVLLFGGLIPYLRKKRYASGRK